MYVRLLGAVGAGPNAAAILPVNGQIPTLVLTQLALAAGRPVTAESLINTTWHAPPESSRNAIQVAVAKLRKQLGTTAIRAENGGYALDGADLEVDWQTAGARYRAGLDEFENGLWASSLELSQSALGLFLGEPIAGIRADFADRWRVRSNALRESLEQLQSAALIELGRASEALDLLRPAATAAPLDEPVHVLLMRALSAQGYQADALSTFQSLRHRLVAELGVGPTPSTEAAFVSILTAGDAVSPPTIASGHSSLLRLPALSRPLFGRDHDVDQLVGALRSGHRLVTVTGPIGIGKSTVALAAAQILCGLQQSHEATGPGMTARPGALIDLGDLTPGTLPTAVPAAALKARIDRAIDPGHRGWGRALSGTSTMLLMDNAPPFDETVMAAVTTLLAVPGVSVLVTCVGPLQLRAEHVYELNPLPQTDGLQIVLDQARLSGDPENPAQHDALQRIAGAAAGLPLLAELFAAGLAWRSPDEFATALDSDMRVPPVGSDAGTQSWIYLEHPALDRPLRHRSFAVALQHMIAPATPIERAAIAALGLICAEFDESMATAMIEAADPTSEPRLVLTRLLHLGVLLRVRHPDAVRFVIPVPVRLGLTAALDTPSAQVQRRYVDLQLAKMPRAGIPPGTVDLIRTVEWMWAHDPAAAADNAGAVLFHWNQRSTEQPEAREALRDWTNTIMDSDVGSPEARARVAIVALLDLFRWRDERPGEIERMLAAMALASSGNRLDAQWAFHRQLVEAENLRLRGEAGHSLRVLQAIVPDGNADHLNLDLVRLRWHRYGGRDAEIRVLVLDLFRRWDAARMVPGQIDATHQVFRALLRLGEWELAERVLSSGEAVGGPPSSRIPSPRSRGGTTVTVTERSLRDAVDHAWLMLAKSDAIGAAHAIRAALPTEVRSSTGRCPRFRLVTVVEAVIVSALACRELQRTEIAHALASLTCRLQRPMLLDAYAKDKLDDLLGWAGVGPDNERASEQTAVQILRQALAAPTGAANESDFSAPSGIAAGASDVERIG